MNSNLPEPPVAVVVLNWNLPEETIACVESILLSTYLNYEIIVVDNGSTDNSVSTIRGRFPWLELIVSKENLGYTGGNNLGIRWAEERGSEYILILNNDTTVSPTLLKKLVDLIETDPSLGILGPAIYYYNQLNRFWRLGAVQTAWSPFPKEIGRNALDKGQFQSPFSVDYVTGCAMWVKTKVFREIGLFDESYFMYYEDADFCCRAIKAGFGIKVVPEAKVWHKVSKSIQNRKSWAVYYQVRNRIIFYHRYYGWPRLLLINSYLLITLLGKTVLSIPNWTYLRNAWRGLFDGYREVSGVVPKTS